MIVIIIIRVGIGFLVCSSHWHRLSLAITVLGILIFLGSVGIRSGATFADAAGTAVGAKLALAAAIVTTLLALASLLLMRVVRSDPHSAAGQIAGIETQPAVHAYASETTNGDERVDAGYALVLPLAMILKLLLVQLLI